MATPINLEVGLSNSEAESHQGGRTGDFTVSGGGAKQTQTLFWVVGLLGVAALAILFFKRR